MAVLKLKNGVEVLIDDDDLDRVSKYSWHQTAKGYIASRLGKRNGKYTYLHRYILNFPPSEAIDHVNRNKLDNRKSNLRSCTHRQNRANSRSSKSSTSRFKGVSWCKSSASWKSSCRINGKYFHLGLFKSALSAAIAYDEHINSVGSSFSYLNFPERF